MNTHESLSAQGTRTVMTPTTAAELKLRMLNGLPDMNRLVTIRGIFSEKEERQGYAYAFLCGTDYKTRIRLYFSNSSKVNNLHLLPYMQEDKLYTLTGFLTFYTSKESVELQMTPVELDGVNTNESVNYQGKDYTRLMNWLHDKKKEGPKDIEALVKEKMDKTGFMTVTLVCPSNSVAQTDIQGVMAESTDFYKIKTVEWKYSTPEEIATTLRNVDLTITDMVILSRGGADEQTLSIFDDMKVLEVLHTMKKPWIAGIGHAKDKFWAELFADHVCITPTEVGNYLNRLYLKASDKNERFPIYEQMNRNNDEEHDNEYLKKRLGSYINPVHTFYGIRWTDRKPIRWFIWMLCLIGLYQVVSLFI